MFGAPVPVIAGGTNWPLMGMLLTTVGLALFLSGLDRLIMDARARGGRAAPEKLRIRLVKLAEQERIAEHQLWLAERQHERYATVRSLEWATSRDTALTKVRAKIKSTEALLNLAEQGSD